MFYDSNLLSKEGPLATVWLAANLEKKLSKSQLLHTNISKTTKAIIESEDPDRRKKSRETGEISSTTSGSETESLSLTQQTRKLVASHPIALRLSGQLLYGVVKIYSRKEKYLLDDVSNVLVKLKTIFRSSNLQTVILPANKTIANVNKLTLPDTITEANVIPQLLQQEPLVFDFDDVRAGAVPPSPPASIGSDERNYEGGADMGTGAVAGHTDFQLSFDYDQSIEIGRNISATSGPGIVGAVEEDEDFVTGGEAIGISSRRDRRGQGPDHDDLDVGGGNDPTQEHDDLMLDFGNDDFQQAPLSPPTRSADLTEQQQQQQQPQGSGDVSLQLDFGDQTVEQGRERRPSVTEHDLTFGVDTLFKEGQTASAAGGVEGEEQTQGALQGDIFNQGPLEVVPEHESEIREQQQREAEETRAIHEREEATTRRNGRKDRKRLHFDDDIEMSGTEFYRSQQVQSSEEIASVRATDLKKKELREKLTNSRELFYLKKYSNPGYFFTNSDSFKQLWDTKGVDAAAQREAKRRRIRQEEGETQEGDEGAVTQSEKEKSTEIPPHDHRFAEPTDNDFNFDLGFDEQFAPEPEYETLEGGTSETKGTITDKDQSSESFLQKMTATELVSSMTGSIRDEVGSQFEGEDVEDKDNDDIASRTSRTDFESFSQAESQTEELGAGAAAGGAGSSISKSTLKIASVLRDAFIGEKDASIDLETVIYRDTHGEDLDQMPLSRQPKKEAVRCFFELLVLATGDAITLKQDKLFGNISVGCKDNLFERF